jgi:hypothetical protein
MAYNNMGLLLVHIVCHGYVSYHPHFGTLTWSKHYQGYCLSHQKGKKER